MTSAGRQRTSTVKVGVLTVVSLTLLVSVLIWLRGKGLAEGAHFTAYFDDVSGLREGAPVQIMGTRIGFVDKVMPSIIRGVNPKTQQPSLKYRVQVIFTVQKNLPVNIPKASRLSIEQSGLIGEQFLEVTPPHLEETTISLLKPDTMALKRPIPVKMLYQEGYTTVGFVKEVRKESDEGQQDQYHFFYQILRPGTQLPDDPVYKLSLDANGEYEMRITSSDNVLVATPEPGAFFTVESPLRMKRFLEIQMESAEALKVTNDKINQLMSDETITSLHRTLKNTEVLTARASTVLQSANVLFKTTQSDLSRMVDVSEQLAVNVSSVSHNVNQILGDPHLRGELSSTASSLQEASKNIRDLLNDPALKNTMHNAQNASSDAAEVAASLKRTVGSPEMQQRLDQASAQLNVSLDQLTRVLGTLDKSLDGKDARLQGIVEDTQATAQNLRKLTNKFNGHFTLFKLLF